MWKCWQDGWGAENAHWAEVPCLPLVLMQVCVRVTVNPWLLLQPVSVAPKLISHVHTNNHAHTGHQAMNPFTRVKQKVFAIVQTRKPVHKPCATKELLFNHTVTQQYSSYIWKEKKKEKKTYWLHTGLSCFAERLFLSPHHRQLPHCRSKVISSIYRKSYRLKYLRL